MGTQRGIGYERALLSFERAADGLTVMELADSNGLTYHNARRYTQILEKEGRIVRTDKKRTSGAAPNGGYVYNVDRLLAAEKMIKVPNLNPNSKPIPIINIVRAAVATPVNETDLVIQAKKVGYYVAKLGRFAYEWRERPDLLDRTEVREFRMELRSAIVRIEWYLRLLKFLDNSDALWDNKRAYDCWFDDEYLPVDPVEVYDAITTIIAKATQ